MLKLMLPLENTPDADPKTVSASVIDIIESLSNIQDQLKNGTDIPEFTAEDHAAILDLDFANLNISLDQTASGKIMLTLK